VVTGVTIAALQIPAAQATPDLPAKTPAQLLTSISTDAKVPPLTGTVVETASLGLPQLPQMANSSSTLSMLTGSHTVRVYYQDASHFRLAIPQLGSETDVIADGTKLWLWQSTADSVTEVVPSGTAKQQEQKVAATAPALTPQQAADQVLAKVGQTTLVSVQANVMVADEPAYQLVLAPKDQRSLVGRVVIAIDGKYGVPLRVQLYAKGAATPAFQVGYQALQFVAPDPANFAFTPPPHAKVDVVKPGAGELGGTGTASGQAGTSGFGTYGKSWLTVAAFPQADLTQALAPGALGTAGKAASSGKQPDIYSANANGVGVSSQELLNALLGSAKPVSGPWGSGTLVTTSLFSMLMTGGEVYVGAVEPQVLYDAVGHTS
jgi:outer membrane lipoprotein-sorting protein